MLRDQFGNILPDPGVGGGAPVTPQAVDPRGFVPIDRGQPMANDPFQAQRLMENRLGSMPPTNFTGAGAGFVPVDRPIQNVADAATDAGPRIVRTARDIYSREGLRRANIARRLAQMSGLLASARKG